jgi:hypothetical protein
MIGASGLKNYNLMRASQPTEVYDVIHTGTNGDTL